MLVIVKVRSDARQSDCGEILRPQAFPLFLDRASGRNRSAPAMDCRQVRIIIGVETRAFMVKDKRLVERRPPIHNPAFFWPETVVDDLRHGANIRTVHEAGNKVQRNYHITLGEDGHNYSIPFQHIGKEVQVVYDADNVEVYLNQCRIAIHKRNYRKGGYTTVANHVPAAHRHYSQVRGWDKEYFIEQASKVGKSTTDVITKILEQKIFIEQTYKTCLGILKLKEKYGDDRLEAACNRASGGYKLNYNIIKNISCSQKSKIRIS